MRKLMKKAAVSFSTVTSQHLCEASVELYKKRLMGKQGIEFGYFRNKGADSIPLKHIHFRLNPSLLTKTKLKTKLHGLSPRANYTDQATAACRRSDCQLLRIEGATWSA
jgi:hypothetical protein